MLAGQDTAMIPPASQDLSARNQEAPQPRKIQILSQEVILKKAPRPKSLFSSTHLKLRF